LPYERPSRFERLEIAELKNGFNIPKKTKLARPSAISSSWTGLPVFCCTTIARDRISGPMTKLPILDLHEIATAQLVVDREI
jgi:hypothetical protein